jgi:hypothetical protein
VVLTKLQVNAAPHAFESAPNYPVAVAVEASSTNDFVTVVNLGTVSAINGVLPLIVLLRRDETYLRLRSTPYTPDGGNYIAYDHLKLSCADATDGWTIVGPGHHTSLWREMCSTRLTR